MKGKWLVFVMSRRRMRILPWEIWMVQGREVEPEERTLPSSTKATIRPARMYAGHPGWFQRNGRMRDDAESAGSMLRRLSRARSRTVGVRRSRDGLQPNRVD